LLRKYIAVSINNCVAVSLIAVSLKSGAMGAGGGGGPLAWCKGSIASRLPRQLIE